MHLWDIHIEEEYQRKGLGKHVLLILELIARQQKMEVLSVPVQLMDDSTVSWISKVRGFAPDTKLHELLKFDPEMEGFEVYAKYFNAPKPSAQAASATVSVSAQFSSPTAKAAPVEALTPSQATPTDVKKNLDFSTVSETQVQKANLKSEKSKVNDAAGKTALTEDDLMALQDTLQELQGLYFQKHGREPTEDEVSQWIDVLSGPDGKEHQRLQQSLEVLKTASAAAAADEDSDADYDKLEDLKNISLDDASK